MNKRLSVPITFAAAIILIAAIAVSESNAWRSIAKMDYPLFVNNIEQIFNRKLPQQYILVSDNRALNKDYSSFWGDQNLDKRSNDSINGDMNDPSRYQFYFVNEEKTILVQLNMIYEPSYVKTSIIAATRHFPDDISYSDSSYSSITDVYSIGYLIAFNGGIAKVDFLLGKEADMENKPEYLLKEGVHKFMPYIEELLLSFQ